MHLNGWEVTGDVRRRVFDRQPVLTPAPLDGLCDTPAPRSCSTIFTLKGRVFLTLLINIYIE